MQRVMKAVALLLCVLFLSACQNGKSPVQGSQSPAGEAKQAESTPTVTPTSTLSPTETATLPPTATSTVTLTPTPTFIPKSTAVGGAGYLDLEITNYDPKTEKSAFQTGIYEPVTNAIFYMSGQVEVDDNTFLQKKLNKLQKAGITNTAQFISQLDADVIPRSLGIMINPHGQNFLIDGFTNVSVDNEKNYVYYVDLKTQQPVKLLTHTHGTYEFAYSPDGNWAVISAANRGENASASLAVVDMKTGKTADLAPELSGMKYRFTFSPDSSKLLFNYYDADITRSGNITSYDVTNNIYIAQNNGSEATLFCEHCQDPGWGPDGKQVVYVKRGQAYENSVMLESIDHANTRTLFTTLPGSAVHSFDYSNPEFSPSGKNIVVWLLENKVGQSYLSYQFIDLESGAITPLANDFRLGFLTGAEWLDWSPDSQWFIAKTIFSDETLPHGFGRDGFILCGIQRKTCAQVGSFSTDNAHWITNPGAMTYVFKQKSDLEGWSVKDGLSWPAIDNGALTTKAQGSASILVSPPTTSIDAAVYPSIQIQMAVTAGKKARLEYAFYSASKFEQNQVVEFDIIPDGQFHTYNLQLVNDPNWQGLINRFHLSPSDQKADVQIKYIRFDPDPFLGQ